MTREERVRKRQDYLEDQLFQNASAIGEFVAVVISDAYRGRADALENGDNAELEIAVDRFIEAARQMATLTKILPMTEPVSKSTDNEQVGVSSNG